MRFALVALVGLSLLGQQVVCQYDDDMGGGDYPDDDYGGDEGYGGDDEEPPPPSSGETQELTTVEEFDAFLDNLDASVVAAFTAKEIKDPEAKLPDGWDEEEDGPWEAPTIEHPSVTAFNSIASTAYGYRFAYTSAPEVLEKLKSKAGGLYVYRSPKLLSKDAGDRPRERFPSDTWNENAVSNWLAAKSQPLVGYYSATTSSRYTAATLVIFLNLDFDANAKGVAYVLKRARKAAAALKGKVQVAVASLDELSYELGDYGLESSKPKSDILMGIKAPKPGGGAADHYGASAPFSATALTSFAEDFLAGKLTAHVKPDPPPYTPPDDDDYGGDDSGGDDYGGDDYSGDEEAGDEPKDEM